MSITLYHHPFTRAANVVWMLEEVGVPYELAWIDIRRGAHKEPEFLALNPMGKLPTLVDGEVVITESAAIALHLADRYALRTLAPEIGDDARATYYRWILYSPSVIEPAAYAHSAHWDVKPGSAGWGRFEDVLTSCEAAIGEGPWLLGERFSMADVVFGGTLGYMTMFGMIEKRPVYAAYLERLEARPAHQRSREINGRIIAERGLA
jgi:glutathione S-transferase